MNAFRWLNDYPHREDWLHLGNFMKKTLSSYELKKYIIRSTYMYKFDLSKSCPWQQNNVHQKNQVNHKGT